jgi:ADP-heptose:LPS heptosyltransferase
LIVEFSKIKNPTSTIIIHKSILQPIRRSLPTPTGDLLIPSPTRWDETCFAVPAVRALLGSGWNIGLLCTADQEAFWKTIPGLPVLTFFPKDGVRSLAKQLHDHWRSALVWEDGTFADAIRKAAIPRTIGPQGERWAKWLSDPADLTEKPKTHRVEYYLATARSLGQATHDPSLFAPVDGPETTEKQPLLLLPDSDFGPSHEWPINRWHDLTKRLSESGRPFRIGSLRPGRGPGKQLAQLTGDNEPILLEPSATALPLFAGFQTLIAADGSLPHLASHVGVDCLTLFGPNDPHWKRPLGRRHRTIRHHVECAPCFLPRCPLDQRCQKELTVDLVWDAFHVFLSQRDCAS